MKIVSTEKLLGITAGLIFCQNHSPQVVRSELKRLEGLGLKNESSTGRLYAITWALENSSQVKDKIIECQEELNTRKIGRTHTEALSQ